MIKGERLLAVIPARGGSKRLPNKNILDFCGKPLIAWTIESGLKSKYIDRIIVSTDSKEIADISKDFGADVPFIRPKEIATDTTSTVDVVNHAINTLNKDGDNYKYLVILQPTSPLRTHKDIDKSVQLLINKNARGIIGVTELDHPIEWSNTLGPDMSMKNFINKNSIGKRSQDLQTRYRINGSIYLFDIEKTPICEESLVNSNYAYIMDRELSIDIDDRMDFIQSEALMKNMFKK